MWKRMAHNSFNAPLLRRRLSLSLYPSLSLLLPLLLLLFLSGCGERSAESVTRPPATEPPGAPTAQGAAAEGAGLRLSLPERIALGEELSVEAVNESQMPYVFYPVDGDNCLHVEDANGRRQPLKHPETCDVLMEVIVRPGERALVGSWDLQVCAGSDCLRRERAAPGRYTVTATFYPGADGDSIDVGREVTVTVEVRVEE